MKNIGIIGAGIAGLQLSLLLQQHDVTTTLYIEQTPEQQVNSRLPNIVIRSAPTCERERLLGVDYWNTPNLHIEQFQVYVAGPRPLTFTGALDRPVSIVRYAHLLRPLARRVCRTRRAGCCRRRASR
ncbi:MAG: hypothetical protein HC828_13050 [Blastochloris sp.]|nr:hypothetical protein [Blastochloris sp.]